MKIGASAPGKLILLGEYAVLEGAPALVMAVNRRAAVTLSECPRGECHVAAPELGLPRIGFRLANDGGIRWQCRSSAAWPRFEFTARFLEGLLAERRSALETGQGFSLGIDTRGLFEPLSDGSGPGKLGLGSSAAVSAALAGVLNRYFGRPNGGGWSPAEFGRLLALYRDSQGGWGSGADLAASLHGGVIRYQLDGAAGAPRVDAVSLPAEIGLRFVWSGRPASTVSYLERFYRWRRSVYAESGLMDELRAVAETGAGCVAAGDGLGLQDAVLNYGTLLARLGEAAGADIVCPAHREIGAIASGLGLAYKPCGAGGGDMGVVLDTDPKRLEALDKRLTDAGFRVLSMAADREGVRVSVAGNQNQ